MPRGHIDANWEYVLVYVSAVLTSWFTDPNCAIKSITKTEYSQTATTSVVSQSRSSKAIPPPVLSAVPGQLLLRVSSSESFDTLCIRYSVYVHVSACITCRVWCVGHRPYQIGSKCVSVLSGPSQQAFCYPCRPRVRHSVGFIFLRPSFSAPTHPLNKFSWQPQTKRLFCFPGGV